MLPLLLLHLMMMGRDAIECMPHSIVIVRIPLLSRWQLDLRATLCL